MYMGQVTATWRYLPNENQSSTVITIAYLEINCNHVLLYKAKHECSKSSSYTCVSFFYKVDYCIFTQIDVWQCIVWNPNAAIYIVQCPKESVVKMKINRWYKIVFFTTFLEKNLPPTVGSVIFIFVPFREINVMRHL